MMDLSVFVSASFEGLCEWLHAHERVRERERERERGIKRKTEKEREGGKKERKIRT